MESGGLGVDASNVDRTRNLVYLGLAAAAVLFLYKGFAPLETNEVTGTIISVTKSTSVDHDFDLLVSIPGTVAAATYSGPARPTRGQEVVLEEVILGPCRDPLASTFDRITGQTSRVIEKCRRRYTVKDASR